ncbi:sodium:solute symporter [Flammeovirga sp. EKP202]|uniref:sodium:solute symporter n=1 Tax=Flammeovirga sp. EKP202 TaxID=2770592 RepID=UPI00165FC7FB|nr:sodium:solute symporter [Flammeovirga sp. EKP202]MBD0402361.1 sodium:solute symporter [Flammeovirga sp. EKP202]
MSISANQSLLIFVSYILLLFLISFWTSKNSSTLSFFNGNKNSPWYAVMYGMIGTTLSGITFISLPGMVKGASFSYLQMSLGYIIGYVGIAYILMPIYYKNNLISIYGYLDRRLGNSAYKTGASFFILSRGLQAAGKLFIMATVLQTFIYTPLGIPYTVNAFILLLIITLYTLNGGIKTVVWTDTLQTTFMIGAGILTLYLIGDQMEMSLSEIYQQAVNETNYTQAFFWDAKAPNYFWKQFITGAFIVIVMTGLDQDMMQKNLTIKTLKEAQKNMVLFSLILFGTIALFLVLGVFLYQYADFLALELPKKSDQLFPLIAQQKLGLFGACIFLLGVTAAAFSSADSAITSLTTSFCIDFLQIDKSDQSEKEKARIRKITHIAFAFVLFLLVVLFNSINNTNALDTILKLASYTYGPLLGLFAFSILMSDEKKPQFVPIICVASPVICYFLQANSMAWLNGYKFGYELLLLNGVLTFLGLLMTSFLKKL